MKQKIDLSVLIVCFFLIITTSVFSQEPSKKQTLVQVISVLQSQHNVQFNYAEDVIKGIEVISPPTDLSLKDALLFLQNRTNFSFSILDNQFVLVKKKIGSFICGFLKDFNTGLPLSSATVQSGDNSTITDSEGFFQLGANTERVTVEIRYLGYKSIYKSFKEFNVNCEDIFMYPEVQSLSEVLLTNYIANGINKINDGTFEIDFSKFDILPGVVETDVLQSIQAFPGIQSVNETVSNINIRGGTHDQNLILWDGIKMYQSGHFFGLISMYNPQITQKVSLLKNGSNVSYTDGVSGTIVMETESKLNTSFKGNLGINLIDANAFVDVPINNKSSIQIAARKGLSNFIETPIYSTFFNRISQDTEVASNTNEVINSDETFDFYDTSLRWIYDMSNKDRLQLNFINVSNQLMFNENAISMSRESSVKQNSIAGGIHYTREWSSKLSTKLEFYETDYKLKAINANIIDAQRFLQENKVSESSFKFQADKTLNTSSRLSSGYHFVETKVTNLDDVDNPKFRLLISEVVRTHALYSQYSFTSLNRKSRLNTGLRLNYIDKFKKTILEPRISFSQQFLENFSFEILGEFKHQNTSQVINFQNDFLGIEKRRWQLSNDRDIPIIRGKQIAAGINFSKKGWLVSFETYLKRVKGITSQSQGFQNQYEFIKATGNYNAKGFDLLFRKKIHEINTWLSYSYLNARYEFPTLESSSFPSNFNINHSLTMGTSYNSEKFKLSAGLNWHSGRPTTIPILGNEITNNEVNFSKTNATDLKDYFRVDVSAIYNFKLANQDAKLGVSIWNLLDRENQINNFYRVINDAISQTIQQSLGFTPNVTFRVYF